MSYIQINGGTAKVIDDSLKLKSNDTLINDMDEHIFEEIYRSHVKTVYRYCLFRTNSYQDAEDITAETFIKLLQEKGAKDRSAYVLPWLLKVAANLSINHNRKSTRRKFAEQAAYSRMNDSLDPWHDNEIWHEVKKLKLKQQQVIYLRLAEDMSFKDIAGYFNEKEGAVKMFYYRTLRLLKKALDKGREDV